jgi:hypothetical protein
VSIRDQPLAAGGGERRHDGQAERPADLRGRVDQAGGEPGVLRRGADHGGAHQRREGQAGYESPFIRAFTGNRWPIGRARRILSG